jgi:hypothetical protein
LYLHSPIRKAMLTEEGAWHVLSEPREMAATLLAMSLLDGERGWKSPPWLSMAAGRWVHGDDPANVAMMNRRLRLDLSRGRLFGPEMFDFTLRAVLKHSGRIYSRDSAAWIVRMHDQAWSLLEFLGGGEAAPQRRSAMRRWLRAVSQGSTSRQAFTEHLGLDLEAIFAEWRVWLAERPLTRHEPATPRHAAIIREVLLPKACDRNAALGERIQAVRRLGSGYLEPVPPLIELLRSKPHTLLEQEAIASLESISGEPYGSDVAAWERWWRGLSPLPVELPQIGPPSPKTSPATQRGEG